jgi:hypothetical protein
MRSDPLWDLRSVERQFLTDVSAQPIGPTLKGQEFQEELTLKYGTDGLYRNVGTTTLLCVISQKRADLI